MVTLFLSMIGEIQLPEIIGYIMVGLEFVLVLIGVLRCFIPPTTKFGKWLRWTQSALSAYLHNKEQEEKKEDSNDVHSK